MLTAVIRFPTPPLALHSAAASAKARPTPSALDDEEAKEVACCSSRLRAALGNVPLSCAMWSRTWAGSANRP
jgi:hypothetical protein